MGVSNVLIARTDSESGKLLSSNIDPRDHEFLLGVADAKSKNVKSQNQLLYELELSGATADEINAAEEKWTKSHPLVTFAEGDTATSLSNSQLSKTKSEKVENSMTSQLPSTVNH